MFFVLLIYIYKFIVLPVASASVPLVSSVA